MLTAPGRIAARAAANAVLIVIALAFLVPLLWLLFASVDPAAGMSVRFPEAPSLENFAAVLTTDITFRPLWNGLLLSGGSSLIAVAVATLAAYPLSRYNLRFKRPFLYTVLFTTGLPLTAIMVPVYGVFVQADLIDNQFATMLFMAATSLPFAIWLIKNFMDGVPISLEEAAWVDGASSWDALRLLVVPLMLPGMAVVAVFTFVQSWGNFFVPFILLLTPEYMPASVTIYTFFGQHGAVIYGQLAAFSLVYTVPAAALWLIASRAMGGAFAFGGALKG
nr:carbohydrate ABC transporter permease [Allonocardiopsis opalescens]